MSDAFFRCRIHLVLSFAAVAMLLVTFAELPGVYDTLLRVVVCAVSLVIAYYAARQGYAFILCAFLLTAVLYNPIWIPSLSRLIWHVLNLAAVALFILAGWLIERYLRIPPKEKPVEETASATTTATCPNGHVNRLHADRPGQAVCGRCGLPLLADSASTTEHAPGKHLLASLRSVPTVLWVCCAFALGVALGVVVTKSGEKRPLMPSRATKASATESLPQTASPVSVTDTAVPAADQAPPTPGSDDVPPDLMPQPNNNRTETLPSSALPASATSTEMPALTAPANPTEVSALPPPTPSAEVPALDGTIPAPTNGTAIITPRGQQGACTLTVTNNAKRDALVKLTGFLQTGSTMLYQFVYVSAGSQYTLRNIAPGKYELLFCVGQGWNEVSRTMTNQSFSGKFKDGITFAQSGTTFSANKVTIPAALAGKTNISSVNKREFDAMQ